MTSRPGALVAIGGNERKTRDARVLRAVTRLPAAGTKRLVVVPVASEVPVDVAEQYVRAFTALDVPDVHVLDVRSRKDAESPDAVRHIREADVVFFTGGDQLRITMLLGGSRVQDAVDAMHARGGVIAGTSAGAAAMSGTMIAEGSVERSLTRGNVQMNPGLGFLPNVVIDTHLIHRGRLSRLLEVIAANPGLTGLGLGEDTGVVIDGASHVARVIGSGVAVVVEGHDIAHTNVCDVKEGEPIAVEGARVHTLPDGYGFDLREKRFLTPDDARRPWDTGSGGS